MEKIKNLFVRDFATRLVVDEVMPGSEWVAAGEGVATRKWDGTCCRVLDGVLWKRFSANKGAKVPADFELAEEIAQKDARGKDVVKVYGWSKCDRSNPSDKHHWDAWDQRMGAVAVLGQLADGTYELCGPQVQGGAEPGGVAPGGRPCHVLYRHGAEVLADVPRTYAELQAYFQMHDIEGVVWHHPDGRMVKIKGKDFGIKRPR